LAETLLAAANASAQTAAALANAPPFTCECTDGTFTCSCAKNHTHPDAPTPAPTESVAGTVAGNWTNWTKPAPPPAVEVNVAATIKALLDANTAAGGASGVMTDATQALETRQAMEDAALETKIASQQAEIKHQHDVEQKEDLHILSLVETTTAAIHTPAPVHSTYTCACDDGTMACACASTTNTNGGSYDNGGSYGNYDYTNPFGTAGMVPTGGSYSGWGRRLQAHLASSSSGYHDDQHAADAPCPCEDGTDAAACCPMPAYCPSAVAATFTVQLMATFRKCAEKKNAAKLCKCVFNVIEPFFLQHGKEVAYQCALASFPRLTPHQRDFLSRAMNCEDEAPSDPNVAATVLSLADEELTNKKPEGSQTAEDPTLPDEVVKMLNTVIADPCACGDGTFTCCPAIGGDAAAADAAAAEAAMDNLLTADVAKQADPNAAGATHGRRRGSGSSPPPPAAAAPTPPPAQALSDKVAFQVKITGFSNATDSFDVDAQWAFIGAVAATLSVSPDVVSLAGVKPAGTDELSIRVNVEAEDSTKATKLVGDVSTVEADTSTLVSTFSDKLAAAGLTSNSAPGVAVLGAAVPSVASQPLMTPPLGNYSHMAPVKPSPMDLFKQAVALQKDAPMLVACLDGTLVANLTHCDPEKQQDACPRGFVYCGSNKCAVDPQECGSNTTHHDADNHTPMNNCPADIPYQCWDGTCQSDLTVCPCTANKMKCENDLSMCVENLEDCETKCPNGNDGMEMFKCWDGVCVDSHSDCACEPLYPHRCPDGRCVESHNECDMMDHMATSFWDTILDDYWCMCPDNVTFSCSCADHAHNDPMLSINTMLTDKTAIYVNDSTTADGHVVAAAAPNFTKAFPCGKDSAGAMLVPCADGSCPDMYGECKEMCPREYPIKCESDGACVKSMSMCWQPLPECAPGCAMDWIGNGICDVDCFNEECMWDGFTKDIAMGDCHALLPMIHEKPGGTDTAPAMRSTKRSMPLAAHLHHHHQSPQK
jgi:hypothetical protein